MKTSKKLTGDIGEDLACRHLQSLGQTIIDRNWTDGHLELDIISFDGDTLHIVEVKTRTAPLTADPMENVGYTKRRRLVQAARAYLASGRFPAAAMGLEIQFDTVSVVLDGENHTIDYYSKAFIPTYV